MLIPSFNQIAEITESRYSLVMLVSKRAKEIVGGDEPLVAMTSTKPVSVAMKEIMEKKITFGEPMSDREFMKLQKEKELAEAAAMEALLDEEMPELLTEEV